MLPLFLLLAAAAPPVQTGTEQRFVACAALVRSDSAAAIEHASRWAKAGGGPPAGQCLGLAYAAREEWGPAAAAFGAAAQAAGIARDGRAANLWVQAGNAALAGGDAAAARTDLDRAIALPVLPDAMKGEAWMDRARADVALADVDGARTDLDKAVALVPDDPMGWLLSATLARRQSDLARAAKDIAEAGRRAPGDPAIALEAGNIAMLSGHAEEARASWQRAAAADPAGDAGKAAKASLDELGAGAAAPPAASIATGR